MDTLLKLGLALVIAAALFTLPAEALEPKVGPVLGYDDLLDFALQLADDDLLAARIGGQITR